MPDIIIGSDNYPPYNYENVDGKPTGIDVDLATEAFRRMGYQAVFTYIDWEKKKELVDSGKIDCIWGSFSIDGREEEYRWSAPYMMSRQVVAVNRDSEIKTLADLEGKRIAVQSTTKPEALFLSHTDARLPVLREVFSMQNRELIYPCLSKGYADAIAAHETAILQCMSDYKRSAWAWRFPSRMIAVWNRSFPKPLKKCVRMARWRKSSGDIWKKTIWG